MADIGTEERIILKQVLNKHCVGYRHGIDYSDSKERLVPVVFKMVIGFKVNKRPLNV